MATKIEKWLDDPASPLNRALDDAFFNDVEESEAMRPFIHAILTEAALVAANHLRYESNTDDKTIAAVEAAILSLLPEEGRAEV